LLPWLTGQWQPLVHLLIHVVSELLMLSQCLLLLLLLLMLLL
jgi:hypothetical protein